VNEPSLARGITARTATRLEFVIIGVGALALLLIFQPISIGLFGVGCGLVVLAALANNLLPLCEPGVPVRTIVTATLVVAAIFVVAVAISIGAAYLYGQFFVGPG
jgi:hypothetical protein